MKMMSFLTTTLVAGAAFSMTTVSHDYSAALHGIELNNACITDTTVQTIADVNHCIKMEAIEHVARSERESSYTEWKCTQYQVSKLSYPRAFQKNVCTEYYAVNSERDNLICKTVSKVDMMLPATIKVRTVVQSDGDRGNTISDMQSDFTFPACN